MVNVAPLNRTVRQICHFEWEQWKKNSAHSIHKNVISFLFVENEKGKNTIHRKNDFSFKRNGRNANANAKIT